MLTAVTITGGKAMVLLTVSDVARQVGAKPRDISDMFYKRVLSDEMCPVVGGRRLIAPEYVSTIVAALNKACAKTKGSKTL